MASALIAADPILIKTGAAGPSQRIPLQIEVLVVGRDAGVAHDGDEYRSRKPVQGSGLQTLKPYTNFLPIEN